LGQRELLRPEREAAERRRSRSAGADGRGGRWMVEYVVIKYREKPEDIVDLAATANPDRAVSLTREWAQRAPDEGLVVVLERQPIVHCAPRRC